MRDSENIMQETSFSSVGKYHKTLTANLTRPQIKIPLPENLKDLEITELQTKQEFHLAFGHYYTNYFNSILKNTIICAHFVLHKISSVGKIPLRKKPQNSLLKSNVK